MSGNGYNDAKRVKTNQSEKRSPTVRSSNKKPKKLIRRRKRTVNRKRRKKKIK